MRNKRTVLWLVGGLLFALGAFGAAAQHSPRVPPKGDSYVNPVKVKLNGSKTIFGVEGATLEHPTLEATECDGDADSTHSVWFSFTVPISGAFELDTAGTWYYGENFYNRSLVISLYSYEFPTLIYFDCLSGTAPKMSIPVLNAGGYLVRIAYEGAAAVTGPSQARLSIRALALGLIDDPGFDEPLGETWKVKNDTTPPSIIRSCPSDCTVRFNGVAGGTIKNSVTLPTDILKVKQGDFVTFSGLFDSSPPTGANVKFKLKISYTDGTPTTTATVVRNFTYTSTGSGTYLTVGSLFAEIKSKAVGKITASITSPQATDLFNVWLIYLTMEAGSNVRDVLPLPPSS